PLPVGRNVDIISDSSGAASALRVNTGASTASDVLGFPAKATSAAGGPSARLVNSNDEPYSLADGMTLVVSVDGGVDQTIVFSSGDFADISEAASREVAQVIRGRLAGAESFTTSRSRFTAIAIAPSDSNRIYAATGNCRVWKSVNGGDVWLEITTGAGGVVLPTKGGVTRIAIDHANPDILYLTIGYSTLGHVYMSDDGGATWQNISGAPPNDLPDAPYNGIVVDPDDASTLYVASDAGVFKTSDGGVNWIDFSENLPNSPVVDICVQEERKLLRCATHGRGTFQRNIDPLTDNPDVDIYLSKNKIDSGEVFPAPSGVPDPTQMGEQVYWWQSTDIKVDSPAYSVVDELVDGVEFEQNIAHNSPLKGMVNRVYVRINNRGPFNATDVTVKLLWADATGGAFPDLPADFWSSHPDDPAGSSPWKPIGEYKTRALLEPAQPRVLRWDWRAPETLPDEIVFLAVISCVEDPITATETVISSLAPNEKRVALLKTGVANAPLDLYIRDSLADDGSIPSSGWAAQSPDIITRKEPASNPSIEFGDITIQPESDKVEIGNDNHIYVRVLNRASTRGTAEVKVYYAPIAITLIPSSWVEIGEVTVHDIPANGFKTSDALVWPNTPDPGAIGHFCIIASIENPMDPRPDASAITDTASFLDYIKNSNNVSYRNFTFENVFPDGSTPPMPFQFHNFAEKIRVDLKIDAGKLPAGGDVVVRVLGRLGLARGVIRDNVQEIKTGRRTRYAYFRTLGGKVGVLRNIPFLPNEESQCLIKVHLSEDVIHNKVYPLRFIQYVNREPIGSITVFIRAMKLHKSPFIGVNRSHLIHGGACKAVGHSRLKNIRPFRLVKEGVINGFDLAPCCLNVYFGPNEISYRLSRIVLNYLNRCRTIEELQKRIDTSHPRGPGAKRPVNPKTAHYIFQAREKLG
ncbi:MAG: hypothetical protein GY859_36325, partial [Desulfobacterales bacterium]|nr:hypothetical protein [Desulfobacterales bacterium]